MSSLPSSSSSPGRNYTYSKQNIRYYKKLVKSPSDKLSSEDNYNNNNNYYNYSDPSMMATMVTQSQAMALEQRLSALERRVGIDRRLHESKSNIKNNNNKNNKNLDDRLSKLKTDLSNKLAEANAEAGTTSKASAINKENWKMIQKLLRELDPGIALTHQQQPLLYKRQQVLACSDELFKDFGELERLLRLLLKGTTAVSASEGAMDATNAATNTKGNTLSSTQTTTASSASATTTKTPQKKKTQQELTAQAKEKAEQKLKQQQQDQSSSSFSRSGSSNTTTTTTLRLDQVTQAPILTQHYAFCEVPEERKRVQDLAHRFMALEDRTRALQNTLRHFLECYHTTAMAVSEKIVLADETIGTKL